MPGPATVHLATLVPFGSVAEEATGTTAVAVAIPANTRCVEVTGATVKHFVAAGAAAAAPDLSEANAGLLGIGATMTFWPHRDHAYLYVEAVSDTGTVDITFYK